MKSDPQIAHDFDPANLKESFYTNPFPTYQALREHSPMHQCPDGSLFLTRYDDVMAVYRGQHEFSSDKQAAFAPKFGDSPLFEHHTTSLVFNDPPLHTRVRRIIAGAFKPGTVQELALSVETLVDRLLDDIEDKVSFDGITDYAALIPVEVIGNLLRVPHEHREPLRQWSLSILGALEAATSEQVLADGNTAVSEFAAYLDELIEDRRANLSDDRDDVLSALIRSEGKGERLTHQELIHNCIFILNAGHETTTNLIGNSVNALLDNRPCLTQLRDSPDLIDSAIEEFLRFESPNQLGNRQCVKDTVIGGNNIKAGTPVWLCIGGANRDPSRFENPDILNLERKPNPHVAFAAGIHTCVGLNVARMEGRIALSRLLHRFPSLERDGAAVRAQRARFRGLMQLPLKTI